MRSLTLSTFVVVGALGIPYTVYAASPRPRRGDDHAMVKFLNLSPDHSAISVRLNGTEEVRTLAYATPTTGHRFAAGSTKIEAREGEKTLVSDEVSLAAGHDYAVAILGNGASLRVELLEPKWEKEKAGLVVVNADPQATPVALLLDAKPLEGANALAFGARAAATVPPGPHEIAAQSSGREILRRPELLQADRCTFLFLTGGANGTRRPDFATLSFARPRA